MRIDDPIISANKRLLLTYILNLNSSTAQLIFCLLIVCYDNGMSLMYTNSSASMGAHCQRRIDEKFYLGIGLVIVREATTLKLVHIKKNKKT